MENTNQLDFIPISPVLIEHVRRLDGFNVSVIYELTQFFRMKS